MGTLISDVRGESQIWYSVVPPNPWFQLPAVHEGPEAADVASEGQ